MTQPSTPADRERFEGRELVRAARILGDLGERDLFRAFVLATADNLPNTEEYALMVDLARGYGDQDLAMRVVRTGAQHGFILPDRGYPLHSISATPDSAEPAIVYGITRQESGFDPRVRSGVGARGMMQLMPETARVVARHIGESYQPGMLDDADYNMRLGASYLGQLINSFSGSYVLATAAYNAGPGRPTEWVGFCGDPRTASVDPVDFIECIPFSETRNYVMRVLESTEVYRARLNGGAAPITLSADLKRGGYVYGGAPLTPLPTGGRRWHRGQSASGARRAGRRPVSPHSVAFLTSERVQPVAILATILVHCVVGKNLRLKPSGSAATLIADRSFHRDGREVGAARRIGAYPFPPDVGSSTS